MLINGFLINKHLKIHILHFKLLKKQKAKYRT